MTEGRLYRSGGATGASADSATPALSKDQRSKLRTTVITDDVIAEEVVVAEPAVIDQDPRDPSDSLVAAIVTPLVAPVAPPELLQQEEVAVERRTESESGMSAAQVWLVITGFTFIVGLIDGFFHRGGSEASALTWITGLALLLTTIVTAIRVSPSARWYPVIVPPLAFLITTITAGQFGLSTTGSLVIREGLMVLTTLGRNAIWIIASVIVALVIVLVKPRLTK